MTNDPNMRVDGCIAWYRDPTQHAERLRLADKLVRLLNVHNRARMTAGHVSRLPGIGLAIDTARARLVAMDHPERKAA